MTDSFDDKVIDLLSKGGSGLLPTDTIYGLSCRALDESAVERLHKLKGRDSTKPFIVLVSDIKMLDLLSISAEQAVYVEKYWPGPISMEFHAPSAPSWLHRGLGHFAIRLPNHPQLLGLINKVGPIVSTSANLQGQAPVRNAKEARALFADKLDFYVDIGKCDNPPSTLVIIKDGHLEVVRQGAVKIS